MITCILSTRDQPDQVVQLADVPQEGQKMTLPSDDPAGAGREKWVTKVTRYPQGGLDLDLPGVPADGPYVIVDLSPRPPHDEP